MRDHRHVRCRIVLREAVRDSVLSWRITGRNSSGCGISSSWGRPTMSGPGRRTTASSTASVRPSFTSGAFVCAGTSRSGEWCACQPSGGQAYAHTCTYATAHLLIRTYVDRCRIPLKPHGRAPPAVAARTGHNAARYQVRHHRGPVPRPGAWALEPCVGRAVHSSCTVSRSAVGGDGGVMWC